MNKLPYVKRIIIGGDDIEDLLRKNFSNPAISIGDLLFPGDFQNESCKFYILDEDYYDFDKEDDKTKQQKFIFNVLKEQFPEEEYVLIDVSW